VTYLEAIRQGIWEEMERDPSVFCIGEDIGTYGGAFKVTDGFIDRSGAERVIDTPIAGCPTHSRTLYFANEGALRTARVTGAGGKPRQINPEPPDKRP
jgi:pyruvate/2-oxoglutarate/acetoin dehydrogenase E1 component